jgi:hypothetical protein
MCGVIIGMKPVYIEAKIHGKTERKKEQGHARRALVS